MEIKKTISSMYPSVILSDCDVESITYKNGSITFFFQKGFVILQNGKYYKTVNSSAVYAVYDISNIDIKGIVSKRNNGKNERIIKSYSLNYFIGKINSKKWRMEIFKELYGKNEVMLIASIYGKTEKTTVSISFQTKEIGYYWSDIAYELEEW